MIIRCPGCGKNSEIEHVERGRHVECVCGELFMLDDSTVVKDYSSLDSTPPSAIGPYPIERLIGRGGMGRVYKGIHPSLGIPVAVKTLLPEYAENKEFKERFINSARICAKMNHPNIVRVYDFGSDQSLLYLVLEYIGGGSCAELLFREGYLTPERVAEIALAVCKGLIEAGKFGIVHRDIKPDNIMRTANGEFKLSDLGLAKMSRPVKVKPEDGSDENPSSTVRFSTLGTLEYMAPEQIIDAKSCDIRADLYALGVTMYQLICGHLPFETSDHVELRRQQLEKEAMVPSEYVPSVPIDMDYIIMRCIRKEREDRYQTPEEVKADLEAFLNHTDLPSSSGSARPQNSENEASEKSTGRRKKWIIILFLLGLAMLSLAFFLHESLIRGKQSSLISLNPIAFLNHGPEPKEQNQPDRDPSGKDDDSRIPKVLLPSVVTNPAGDVPQPKDEPPKSEPPKFWDVAVDAAKIAMKERKDYDRAIGNFQAYLSSDYKDQAQAYINELSVAKDTAVAEVMAELAKEASVLAQKRNYEAAAELYEKYQGRLRQETEGLRKNLAEPMREKASSVAMKIGLEQFSIHLVNLLMEKNVKGAMSYYERKNGMELLPTEQVILESLNDLPAIYAKFMGSRVDKTDAIVLKGKERLAYKIIRIEASKIFAEFVTKDGRIRYSVVFDFNQLDPDAEQMTVIGQMSLSKEAIAIWQGTHEINREKPDFKLAISRFRNAGALAATFVDAVYKKEMKSILKAHGVVFASPFELKAENLEKINPPEDQLASLIAVLEKKYRYYSAVKLNPDSLKLTTMLIEHLKSLQNASVTPEQNTDDSKNGEPGEKEKTETLHES